MIKNFSWIFRKLKLKGNIMAVGLVMMAACAGSPDQREEDGVYLVNRISKPVSIDANWQKPVWKDVKMLTLAHHMGERPAHFPKTRAKLLYDDQAIYVIFRVEDQYVRAVADAYQGPVYRDSCVEFFFTPGMDIKKGYFNLEMNCGGTALFCHQKTQGVAEVKVDSSDFQQMTVAHSLPSIIDPELTAPTTWTVEYRLPFSILQNYTDFKSPSSGDSWRANFYKCADATSHPHWLTWAPVDFPTPRFHLPEFFGELRFQ